MSLINEALRKARQAASEHDTKQPEGPFRPARAYPSRQSGRRIGLTNIMLIAIAAGAAGAALAWWVLGGSETPPSEIVSGQNLPFESPVAGAPIEASPTSPEETAPVVALPEPTAMLETAVPSPVREQEGAEPGPPATTAEKPSTGSGGERVFVMEAELGYASLSLGFIVARANNPFAEINGREVWIDSEIEGFVVEAIEANRVVLRDDKGPLILRVP